MAATAINDAVILRARLLADDIEAAAVWPNGWRRRLGCRLGPKLAKPPVYCRKIIRDGASTEGLG
jgi:hypothetical protein